MAAMSSVQGAEVQGAEPVPAAALLVLASRAAPARRRSCRRPRRHRDRDGAQVRVGAEVVVTGLLDLPRGEEGFETGYLTRKLLDPQSLLLQERAVPLDTAAVFVPRRAHVG